MTQQPPKKLFRDEAQAETVKCLACGAPIALHSFGAVQRVICPHCGSVLAPEHSGALALLEAAARQRQASALPLHARGTLDDIEWQIIGICWRRCVVDGVAYPWQEFLLFNPYRGVRWLIYNNSDGHWSLGANLDGAPEVLTAAHRHVRFKDRRYKHFQGADAVVTYVEGEFTWEVHVGDQAHTDDFVAPPHGLSIEMARADDGAELTFTVQRYLDAAEVWRAFNQPGRPPKAHGVGAIQPNHWRRHRRQIWLSCLLFVGLWAALDQHNQSGRQERTVFSEAQLSFDEPFSRELTIGRPGQRTAIELVFSAAPLIDAWAYADIMLINIATEEALSFGVEASYYAGVDDGEAWTEDNRRATVTLGGIEGGDYLLQLQPQRHTSTINELGKSIYDGASHSPTHYSVALVEDVYLLRYSVLALIIILGLPLFGGLLALIFEHRRWKNSDYVSSSSDDDDDD